MTRSCATLPLAPRHCRLRLRLEQLPAPRCEEFPLPRQVAYALVHLLEDRDLVLREREVRAVRGPPRHVVPPHGVERGAHALEIEALPDLDSREDTRHPLLRA